MVIDFWVQFSDTPAAHGIRWSTALTCLAYIAAKRIHHFAVPGSHRAYQSATAIRTLLWPVFTAYLFCAAMNLFTQDWFGAGICAFACFLLLRDWEKYKDTDDWWKGKGTKLKKKLRSLFTASSPAMAGAGA